MTAELDQNAATGAPASIWKPYPAYDSGVEWLGKVPGNNAKSIFQTGLTGYVLSFNPVHPVILSRVNKPQINADERRLIESVYRKVGYELWFMNKHEKKQRTGTNWNELRWREFVSSSLCSLLFFFIPEHKTEPHKSLYPYKNIRPETRMTKRISTDNPIRAYPRHPRNPRSIVYDLEEKIMHLHHFSSIREQEAAQ